MAGVEADCAGADDVVAQVRVENIREARVAGQQMREAVLVVRVHAAVAQAVFRVVQIGVQVDVREAEAERGGHRLAVFAELVVRAGPDRQVAVAGAVHIRFRAVGGEARLVGNDDRAHLAVFGVDVAQERAEQDRHAVFRHKLIVNALERLGVDRHPVDVVRRDVRRKRLRAFENGLRHAAVNDLFLVGKRAPGGHKAGGAHAAERAGRLDQKRFGALARCGGRGGAAGRAAADHDHVV